MASQLTKHFNIAILGGGISGSAIFHVLSKYTNVESIGLLEKCAKLGQINSNSANNSQTLHFGDIETNYSLEKATATKSASEIVVKYLERQPNKKIYSKAHKLALAVGPEEIARLKKRHADFKDLFPESKLIDRAEITKVEPQIVKQRPESEEILAIYSDKSYVVDFGQLAHSLATEATQCNTRAEISTNTKINAITKQAELFVIKTNQGTFTADVVIVAMCAHSLMYAKSLGYGLEYSILPVGGNFYTTNHAVLNGKVYTMQNGKLPFAAVHGDPMLENTAETRFGPTANIMPFLERNNLKTFFDFHKSSLNQPSATRALIKVIFEPTLFRFLLQSLIYDLPYFGPRAFAKLCKKIIPSLTYADFKKAKTKAGIRPQLINNATGKLMMGEIEITGDKILFNVTPSPGATACLQNAVKSTKKCLDFFENKFKFDQEKFDRDFL